MFSSFQAQVPLTIGAAALTAAAIALTGALPAAAGDLGPFTCTDRSGGVAEQLGDFEAVLSWGAGLSQPSCIRTLELSNPTRLVIDVQTP